MTRPPDTKATSEIRPWITLDKGNLRLLFVTYLNLLILASDSLSMVGRFKGAKQLLSTTNATCWSCTELHQGQH